MIGRGSIKKTYKATGFFYYGTGGRKEVWRLTMAEAVKELDIYGDWKGDGVYFDPESITIALNAGKRLQTPLAYYELSRGRTEPAEELEE